MLSLEVVLSSFLESFLTKFLMKATKKAKTLPILVRSTIAPFFDVNMMAFCRSYCEFLSNLESEMTVYPNKVDCDECSFSLGCLLEEQNISIFVILSEKYYYCETEGRIEIHY